MDTWNFFRITKSLTETDCHSFEDTQLYYDSNPIVSFFALSH